MSECSKGWAKRCANAKHPRCTCKCGGHNHGAKKHQPQEATTNLPGFRYQYKGFGGCDCECQIEIIRRDGQTPIVVATELPTNHGTSITNLAEQLAAQINVEYLGGKVGEQMAPMVWIEHYPCRCPYASRGLHEMFSCESFDVVTFGSTVITETWNGRRMITSLGTPDWKHLGREAADAMVGRSA